MSLVQIESPFLSLTGYVMSDSSAIELRMVADMNGMATLSHLDSLIVDFLARGGDRDAVLAAYKPLAADAAVRLDLDPRDTIVLNDDDKWMGRRVFIVLDSPSAWVGGKLAPVIVPYLKARVVYLEPAKPDAAKA
jgi:hypothetical protein